jgi:hypothetical protein
MHLNASEPQMTVREARKLLGRKYSHLDDDQIRNLILNLTVIARDYLKNIGSNNT